MGECLGDNGSNAESSGIGDALRELLHGEVLELFVSGVLLLISAGHASETAFRTLQPLREQDRFKLSCVRHIRCCSIRGPRGPRHRC